jgi:hypothetical protein
MQDTWGPQQEMRDLGGCWGDTTREPRRPPRTEVMDAGGPTRLSKVVAVSVVQRVEQVCVGGWEFTEIQAYVNACSQKLPTSH